MSTASAEVPEFQPPPVTIGDHTDVNFKDSSTVYHSGTKVLKATAIEVGRSLARRETRERMTEKGWERAKRVGFGGEQERKGANNIEEELRVEEEQRRQFKSKRIERER